MSPGRPYILRMNVNADPLKRFEQAPPQSRAALLKLWGELAPEVRAADPERYRCIQEALAQDLPLPILVLYIFRESRRALEDNGLEQRAVR